MILQSGNLGINVTMSQRSLPLAFVASVGNQAVLEIAELVDAYPLVSIEDPLDEEDWAGWTQMTEQLGDKVQLVGDDLFVTNTKILREGIEKGIANSILIKINQIGTLSETFAAIEMAKRNANLNNARIEFVHADAFSWIRQMQKNGKTWDLVLCDPPKFVDSRDEEFEAEGLKKYNDLNVLAMQLVAPGGLFVTCSCSGLVSAEAFEDLYTRSGVTAIGLGTISGATVIQSLEVSNVRQGFEAIAASNGWLVSVADG